MVEGQAGCVGPKKGRFHVRRWGRVEGKGWGFAKGTKTFFSWQNLRWFAAADFSQVLFPSWFATMDSRQKG